MEDSTLDGPGLTTLSGGSGPGIEEAHKSRVEPAAKDILSFLVIPFISFHVISLSEQKLLNHS